MTAPPAIVERIARFVDELDDVRLGPLLLEAFAFQYRHIAAYRRLCDGRGVRPGTLDDPWTIPAIPVLAFKSLRLHAAPPVEIFRSSGTTAAARSVHYHPFPELYRRVIDASFPRFCLPRGLAGGERMPMLSLVPSRRQVADSSLGFMIDHVLGRFATADSVIAFGERGVDVEAATGWCEARAADRRPGLVAATAFALVQWLEALAARGQKVVLPAGTVIFETGGFKGKVREISRGDLLHRLEATLGVPPGRVVREYGMTELTGQLYTRVLDGGDGDLFVAPPWMRVRILEPESLTEAAAGQPGIVAILDLSNVGSALHLLTEDLGVAEGEGFRLLGRAGGAELRGCSLTVEELEAAAEPAGRPRTGERTLA